LTSSILSYNALLIRHESSGLIGDVAVYRVDLSPVDAEAIYNKGRPGNLKALNSKKYLVGWWCMGDEDEAPVTLDLSGNEYYGKMRSMGEENIVGDAPGVLVDVAVYVDGVQKYELLGLPLPEGGWDGSWRVGGAAPPLRVNGIRVSDKAKAADEILSAYRDGFKSFTMSFYYKMRAMSSSGYVSWQVRNSPDFLGDHAPVAIQGGTAAVVSKWKASP